MSNGFSRLWLLYTVHVLSVCAVPTSDDSAEAEVWREIYGELGSSSLSMVDAGVFFFRTTGRDMDPWMMAIVDPFPQVFYAMCVYFKCQLAHTYLCMEKLGKYLSPPTHFT